MTPSVLFLKEEYLIHQESMQLFEESEERFIEIFLFSVLRLLLLDK